jgi:hydroxyethylthiazole kinase
MSPEQTLRTLRARRPLVHSITNLVVANLTANALLAIGASPAMVGGISEAVNPTPPPDALVVNLGTMTRDRAEAMVLATASARAHRRPWVLDPVAVGVLDHRSRVAVALLEARPDVIRGNASEIIALARRAQIHQTDAIGGRGVDSGDTTEAALPAAMALARTTGAVVAISGAIDRITDGTRLATIANGDAMMPLVTGLGCTASALIGACLAAAPPFEAALHGALFTALAGEIAAEGATGPATLQLRLIDTLHTLGAADLARARLTDTHATAQDQH